MSRNNFYEQFKDKNIEELNLSLINACRDGEIEKVKYLLTSPELNLHAKAQCHDGDYDLMFPLKSACFKGHLDIVKYLLASPELKEHADIHFEHDESLQIACNSGHLNVVKYLLTSPDLKEHADIKLAGGGNPLSGACLHGYLDVLDYLLTSVELKTHADIGVHFDSPLRMACLGDQLKVVEYILTFPGYATQKRINFAFTEACSYGRKDIVQFLFTTDKIEYRPNIHVKKDDAFAKLMQHEESELLSYLIFDLEIKKNKHIKKYLKENPCNFTNKINDWFNLREVNKQLNKELNATKSNTNKRIKL
jgi:hypothetical protein